MVLKVLAVVACTQFQHDTKRDCVRFSFGYRLRCCHLDKRVHDAVVAADRRMLIRIKDKLLANFFSKATVQVGPERYNEIKVIQHIRRVEQMSRSTRFPK
jgi:hypothetical protein